MLLGADWAQQLGIKIEWLGPVLTQTHSKNKCQAVQPEAPTDLTQHQIKLMFKLKEYTGVFCPPRREPAAVPFHHIIRIEEGTRLFRSPPYRMTAEQLTELRKEIEEYIDLQWVQLSQSPWGAPITYVPKKDGTKQLVFDYRRLNKVTLPDASPLPRIDDLLANVARSKVFSKIDLKQGYNQIPIERESIPLTAFVTPILIRGANHFEWTVLPFGLMNAPPTFQRVSHHVMQGCKEYASVYMDDIFIYSPNHIEHLVYVLHVMDRLNEAKLHVKAAKCE